VLAYGLECGKMIKRYEMNEFNNLVEAEDGYIVYTDDVRDKLETIFTPGCLWSNIEIDVKKLIEELR